MESITAYLPLHSLNYEGEEFTFNLYIRGRREYAKGEPDIIYFDHADLEDIHVYVGKSQDYEEVLDTEFIERLKNHIGEEKFKELLTENGA